MTFNIDYTAAPQCMLNNIFIYSRRNWYVKHKDFFIASKKLALNAVIHQLDFRTHSEKLYCL